MGGRESGTKSTKPRKSKWNAFNREGLKRDLVPPGRQYLADRVVWHDNGSSSFGGLLMGGMSLGNRQD
jgi:hypothetical protein